LLISVLLHKNEYIVIAHNSILMLRNLALFLHYRVRCLSRASSKVLLQSTACLCPLILCHVSLVDPRCVDLCPADIADSGRVERTILYLRSNLYLSHVARGRARGAHECYTT
jgi:hypothetical protein